MGRLRVGVRGRSDNRIPANAEARVNDGMRNAIVEATRDGRLLTQAATPRRRPYTYTTVESVVMGGGPHVSGHFGSNYEVFDYLERGTRPHIIRGNPWLSWPGARHPVRQVQHPGTVGQHMLERSAEVAGAVAKMKLGDVYAEVFG